jgi:hypothetical protein
MWPNDGRLRDRLLRIAQSELIDLTAKIEGNPDFADFADRMERSELNLAGTIQSYVAFMDGDITLWVTNAPIPWDATNMIVPRYAVTGMYGSETITRLSSPDNLIYTLTDTFYALRTRAPNVS